MKKVTRLTKQKKIILDVLRSTKSHPTADWVYEQARKQLPNISLGTVYRNLNMLVEMGEIMELNYGSTFSRFDGTADNHYHFVCTQCGQVSDLELPLLEAVDTTVEEVTGNIVEGHRLEFYGVCANCKARQK